MDTRYRVFNYLPEQVYVARSMASEMGVSVSGDYHDLPHQAYDARKLGADHRFGFAGALIVDIMESDPKDRGLVYRAEALHLVSVPMLNEQAPRDLVEMLAPALDTLVAQRRDFPELHRYSGLLLRTASLAASKLDSYTHALEVMNRAHHHLNTDRELTKRTAIYLAEVRQQIYLQECGQLARNVEAALLEQDRDRVLRSIDGELPDRDLDRGEELRALRVVARAAAEAGARAAYWINFVKKQEGLPEQVNPDNRRLSVSSWYVTCMIMYMRSLLLAGLVELCAGGDALPYLTRVPDVWASVIEKHAAADRQHAEPKLDTSHRMDLTRNALLWAFLHGGDHPYRPRPWTFIREGVPEYLYKPNGARLDTMTCSTELAAETHNAGILDNLAHRDTYLLFSERGGSGALGYDSWLSQRHVRLKSVVHAEDPNPKEIRTVGGPTLAHLKGAAEMVRRSGRYEKVTYGL